MHSGSTTSVLIHPAPQSQPPACAPESLPRPTLTFPVTTPTEPTRPRRDPIDPQLRDFAIVAISRILEVLDLRRPLSHLGKLVQPHVYDQISCATAQLTVQRSGSTLLAVHLQAVDHDTAEIAASYRRGDHIFALAARVARGREQSRPGSGVRPVTRCRVAALALG